MLTRKQKWMRVKKRPNFDFRKYEEPNSPVLKENFNKDILNQNAKRLDRKYIKENNIKNKVEFSSIVSVILIPIIQDYKDAKLNTELWYSRDDYFLFENTYREEIRKSKYNSI